MQMEVENMVSVLLVEDDTNVHELLTRMLAIRGHIIIANAFNGEEAVEIFRRLACRPDVILMDYRMPLMNGIEAAEKIIDIDPSARIVFLSADAAVKDQAIKLGVCGFLKKPISCVEIVASIENHASDIMNNQRATSLATH
jgi:two-component system chemotaxis response regulator CheY